MLILKWMILRIYLKNKFKRVKSGICFNFDEFGE